MKVERFNFYFVGSVSPN